jgi:hypothetical protein
MVSLEWLVWYFSPAESIVKIFLVKLVFSRQIPVYLRWEVVQADRQSADLQMLGHPNKLTMI